MQIQATSTGGLLVDLRGTGPVPWGSGDVEERLPRRRYRMLKKKTGVAVRPDFMTGPGRPLPGDYSSAPSHFQSRVVSL